LQIPSKKTLIANVLKNIVTLIKTGKLISYH